jgi:hypothetical protein
LTFILQFTPDASDGMGKFNSAVGPYFLVRLGEQWPHEPRYRLIHQTTLDRTRAKEFATEEDARTCLAEANASKGWSVVSL